MRARGLAREMVRADAMIDARAGPRRSLDHRDRHRAARAVGDRRRRDRVVARHHQRHHFEECREGQLAGRELFQQVEHRFAPGQNLGPEAFLLQQCFEPGSRERATRVLRHRLDLLARRGKLQLQIVGQQTMDGDRLARGQSRAPSFGRRQLDMGAGREAEAPHRPRDQRRAVLRHDAEMIAGAIAHAVRQHAPRCAACCGRMSPDSAVRDWPGPASAARRCRR